MESSVNSKIFRPPTLMARDESLNLAPWHLGHGTSSINSSILSSILSELDSVYLLFKFFRIPSNPPEYFFSPEK